jgi:hypothetical protein
VRTKSTPYRCVAASLIALMACPVYGAESQPEENQPAVLQQRLLPQPAFLSQPISQTLYKGVIGSVLEELPMEPEKRVDLQRGSSVISGISSGRSLAVLLGVTNPVLLAVGLAWGLFAASKITPVRAQAPVPPPSNPFPGAVGTIVDRAIVSADGTITRPANTQARSVLAVSDSEPGMLLCIDVETDEQTAAVRPADEPLALIR